MENKSIVRYIVDGGQRWYNAQDLCLLLRRSEDASRSTVEKRVLRQIILELEKFGN